MYLPAPPMASTNASPTRPAPCALLETIWALAMPSVLISRSMRKTGMPASAAFCTLPMLSSAPALSRMIATALFAMAASISWLSLIGSSSCELTETSYPSSWAFAAAPSASALKNSLETAGVMMAIRPPASAGASVATSVGSADGVSLLSPDEQPARASVAAARTATLRMVRRITSTSVVVIDRSSSTSFGCPRRQFSHHALRGDGGRACALESLLTLIEHHSEDDDQPLDHGLPEGGDVNDGQAIRQETDDESADERPLHRASAAREGRTADDDGGDCVQLEQVARSRGSRGELGRGDQACQPRADARDHVHAHLDLAYGHAAQLCRALVAAGRVDPATERRPVRHHGDDHRGDNHDPDSRRQAERTLLAEEVEAGVAQRRLALEARERLAVGDEQCCAAGHIH